MVTQLEVSQALVNLQSTMPKLAQNHMAMKPDTKDHIESLRLLTTVIENASVLINWNLEKMLDGNDS